MNTIPLPPGLDSWKPTHSQHLERWLGADGVENVSRNMRWFYWPVPVAGVPGNVYAMPGGDFAGRILTNGDVSAVERLGENLRRSRKYQWAKIARSRKQLGAFASADAVYAAVTGGKAQFIYFAKTGVASNAIGNANDVWSRAGNPGAGAAGAAAPGGTIPTNASTGALGWANPANANTGHFLVGETTASVINMTLLLYDRLFAVAKTMNSTANEAVTGVPTRYTNQTSTALDYIGGNFAFPSNPTTVLAATAHNWTAGGGAGVGCTYTNQAGSAANFPVATGVSACVVGGVDLVASTPGWFMPLAASDVGVKTITDMACSALVATGTIDFVIGHPIALLPNWVANLICIRDGLRGSINLTSVFDGACLTFLEMPKSAVTATNYSGLLTLVAE